ncbi:dipeptidase PepV [Terribacillus saccharophilus]|uniref:dipeptidase PepV n=1 Tax=Terribacillus saccharophilus TaxID=361277 RepID=UPI000C9B92BD|nr:dipeptidase PepV [Terribacillus goriensis]
MEKINWYEKASAYKDDYVKVLKGLVSIPSVYDESTKTDKQPFGEKIDEALTYILQVGKNDGFVTKYVDGYAGHIEYGQGEGLVGVLGHLDVVPADGEWTYGAFNPTLADDHLFGRGTLDDKGPVVAAYFAMKLLKDLGYTPKKRVRLIMGTDEERDWQCMTYYFEHEEMPDTGFTPDADFPLIYAEKGIIDGYISLPPAAAQSDMLRLDHFKGGKALNMVPGLAEAVLTGESLAKVEEAFTAFLAAEGYSGKAEAKENAIQLSLSGKAAHGSTPEKGTNAVVALAKFLVNLPLHGNVTDKLSWLIEKFEDYNGNGIDLGLTDDVSGPLTLNLGEFSMKDSEAWKIGVNIRYPVTTEYDAVTSRLFAQLAEAGAGFHETSHLASLYVEKDDPLVETLLDVYHRQTGDQTDILAIGGGTYARAMKKGVAFGPLFPGGSDSAHQQDEHILVDDMLRSIAIYAEALYLLTKDERG